MRLGIDLDGVIFDFTSAYRQLARDKCGIELGPALRWNWDADKLTKDQSKELWAHIIHTPGWWSTVQPYPDAREFLHKLEQTNHEVFFITSRSSVSVKKDTEEALVRLGLSNPTVIPVNRPEKKIHILEGLDIRAMIDDRVETVKEIWTKRRKTVPYIYDQPWNQDADLPRGIKRIQSLNQFLEIINNG